MRSFAHSSIFNPLILPNPLERIMTVNHVNQTDYAKGFHLPPPLNPLVPYRGIAANLEVTGRARIWEYLGRAQESSYVGLTWTQRRGLHVRELGRQFFRLSVPQSSTNPRATLTDSKTQQNTGKRLASSIYHPTVIIQLIISKSLNPTFFFNLLSSIVLIQKTNI